MIVHINNLFTHYSESSKSNHSEEGFLRHEGALLYNFYRSTLGEATSIDQVQA